MAENILKKIMSDLQKAGFSMEEATSAAFAMRQGLEHDFKTGKLLNQWLSSNDTKEFYNLSQAGSPALGPGGPVPTGGGTGTGAQASTMSPPAPPTNFPSSLLPNPGPSMNPPVTSQRVPPRFAQPPAPVPTGGGGSSVQPQTTPLVPSAPSAVMRPDVTDQPWNPRHVPAPGKADAAFGGSKQFYDRIEPNQPDSVSEYRTRDSRDHFPITPITPVVPDETYLPSAEDEFKEYYAPTNPSAETPGAAQAPVQNEMLRRIGMGKRDQFDSRYQMPGGSSGDFTNGLKAPQLNIPRRNLFDGASGGGIMGFINSLFGG